MLNIIYFTILAAHSTFKNINSNVLFLIISYIFCSCFPPFIPVDVSVDVKSLFSTLLKTNPKSKKAPNPYK